MPLPSSDADQAVISWPATSVPVDSARAIRILGQPLVEMQPLHRELEYCSSDADGRRALPDITGFESFQESRQHRNRSELREQSLGTHGFAGLDGEPFVELGLERAQIQPRQP